jgi:hypothetical protein
VGVNVDPLGEPLGISVFPEAFLGPLGAIEPVAPDPVVFIDEPVVVPLVPLVGTPVPVVGPLIPVAGTPVVCASANVLESAKAVASAIVVSFMSCPSCRFDNRQPDWQFNRSLNSSLSAAEAPACSHLAEP